MFDSVIETGQLDNGEPLSVKLAACAKDRQQLAGRFDWIDVTSVEASLEVKLISESTYHVTGRIEAAIIQRCRLSGNPVPESITVDVEERFASLDMIDETGAIDPLAVTLEALEGDAIPLGEMIAQLVALEASPWPRDPDAASDNIPQNPDDASHPFASLAEMKKNR